MDRRSYDRAPVAFHVDVTVLADPEISTSGEAIDISTSGMCISLPLRVVPGRFVRLNIADSVLYGVVVYAQEWPVVREPFFARNKQWIGGSESNGAAEADPERSQFRTGIEVYEVLMGTSGLSALLKATLDEKMPSLQPA
jgi:hypothetical protein